MCEPVFGPRALLGPPDRLIVLVALFGQSWRLAGVTVTFSGPLQYCTLLLNL